MWPSSWIELIAQVSEISGERASFIRSQMPLAECFQFQQVWFSKNGFYPIRPERREESGPISGLLKG